MKTFGECFQKFLDYCGLGGLDMIEELNNSNFKKHIEKGLKLVEFYANWCGFCKQQFPVLEELTNIVVGIVDIDENPDLVREYKVGSYPTFIIFKNGVEAARFSGMHSKYDLMNKVMQFL